LIDMLKEAVLRTGCLADVTGTDVSGAAARTSVRFEADHSARR
jgi:hypothetical protein